MRIGPRRTSVAGIELALRTFGALAQDGYASAMTGERMAEVDLEFVRRVYDRSGGSLDAPVEGDEIGRELGLDEASTGQIVARLVRTGYLRDVAAHFRVKVTIRTIALVRVDRAPFGSDARSGFDDGSRE